MVTLYLTLTTLAFLSSLITDHYPLLQAHTHAHAHTYIQENALMT